MRLPNDESCVTKKPVEDACALSNADLCTEFIVVPS